MRAEPGRLFPGGVEPHAIREKVGCSAVKLWEPLPRVQGHPAPSPKAPRPQGPEGDGARPPPVQGRGKARPTSGGTRTPSRLILSQACIPFHHAGWVRNGCPLVESNHRHRDFQSLALPTELREPGPLVPSPFGPSALRAPTPVAPLGGGPPKRPRTSSLGGSRAEDAPGPSPDAAWGRGKKVTKRIIES